jgi:hypothetical protein
MADQQKDLEAFRESLGEAAAVIAVLGNLCSTPQELLQLIMLATGDEQGGGNDAQLRLLYQQFKGAKR